MSQNKKEINFTNPPLQFKAFPITYNSSVPGQNSSPGTIPKEKRTKKNVGNVPKIKKKDLPPL